MKGLNSQCEVTGSQSESDVLKYGLGGQYMARCASRGRCGSAPRSDLSAANRPNCLSLPSVMDVELSHFVCRHHVVCQGIISYGRGADIDGEFQDGCAGGPADFDGSCRVRDYK